MSVTILHRECSRLKMQVEDLQEQAREVQLLRVTKDLQLSLSEEDHRARDQHNIETLEKTLELNERVISRLSVAGPWLCSLFLCIL